MCLAIPGQVMSIEGEDPLFRKGKVSFGGILKEVSLTYLPEARVGDYVLVHVGVALSIIDEEEARKNLDLIEELEHLSRESAAE
jgi:hydrogenase expression/formation protein HypC